MPRKRRKTRPRPLLCVRQILAWADDHHRQTGHWPQVYTGPVRGGPVGESWRNIDNALRYGLRGLRGGSSLAKLLAHQRDLRNPRDLPPLSKAQILAWAKAHHHRTGAWPNRQSGPIRGHPGERWEGVDNTLRHGRRCLPGGSTLAKLLAHHLGLRTRATVPPLSVTQILTWADAHFQQIRAWPKRRSGPIFGAIGETWKAVDVALSKGCRGLPGGGSLARLLAENRGAHPPNGGRGVCPGFKSHG